MKALNPLVAGSSPARVTFREAALSDSMPMVPLVKRVVTLVSWAFAPEWLTIQEACELSGHDADIMRWLVEDGAVDTRHAGDTWLIEKASLREFQEALLEVRQGVWG